MEKVALLFVLCLSCVLVFGQNDRTTTPSCRKDQTLVCTNPCTTVPTCQNPNATRETLISCGGLCLHACVCDAKQGLILDENTQKCVKKEDCPPACKPGEEKRCIPCLCHEATCQNPKPSCRKDMICSEDCRPFCVCKQGYLRDNSTGTCVPQDNCPSAA
ncbi:keratin-associated protein 10-1 isoform X2 [Diabrotica virgifera virgifera]|uniref:Keratin-associated protein 10-1 isoform X2 n=1 Tax=Diabrotica virgifera virgifera TaxID=50390 RepID=A0A6P7GHI3_DIAVI|nr:keratin-associated protein 10-1 isoform X2 [Diabrotica virgifera virgifera]